MLVAEEREAQASAVEVTRDKICDDGVDEKRIAAVDEEVELLPLEISLWRRHVALREWERPQNPSARTSSRKRWTLRSLMVS